MDDEYPVNKEYRRLLSMANDRELLRECLRAFVALSSATASTNRLILIGLQRQYGMTPQEDLADQMAKILHAALGEEK